MRAAVIHVIADATVSVFVIIALLLARTFGWLWTDPAAGIIGAFVIASWSYALIRDTGSILLDMNPDWRMADNLRQTIEADGDRLADLHLWRLGPGHLGQLCVSAHAKAAGRTTIAPSSHASGPSRTSPLRSGHSDHRGRISAATWIAVAFPKPCEDELRVKRVSGVASMFPDNDHEER